EGEIAARGAEGDIAFVEHQHALSRGSESPGDGGADQPAADHCEVVVPARLRGGAHQCPLPTSRRSRPYARSSTSRKTTVTAITQAETEVTSGSMLSWM